MMNMHSKYDNMHRNGMFYALLYINNHENTSISCMLSLVNLQTSSLEDVCNSIFRKVGLI